MIEIITDKERNLKNLKQIGTPKDEDKIYIENFAYAKIKEHTHREKKVFVLMGHTERMQGRYATFVEAVIPVQEIEFSGGVPHWNNKIWAGVFHEIKRLYENMIIVGWAVDMKGMSPKLTPQLERGHREHFGGSHQLLFLLDSIEQEETFFAYKENHLVAKEGFYIYHRARKKEALQENAKELVSVAIKDFPKAPRESVTKEDFRKVSRTTRISNEPNVDVELEIPDIAEASGGKYRKIIQENSTDKIEESGNIGLAIAIAMLVFVVGVGVYENRGDIFRNSNSIEVDALPGETETETEVKKIEVEIISGTEE